MCFSRHHSTGDRFPHGQLCDISERPESTPRAQFGWRDDSGHVIRGRATARRDRDRSPDRAAGVGRRLEEIAVEAGIERQIHPHMLRHTFALAVYARTGDVLVTARALCHRSVASTAVYARPNAAQVREAVRG